MKPWVVALAALTCLVWTTSQLQGQTAESRLAALEKLPNQERQQRLLEGAKSEGEGVIYANMDVAAMKPLTEGFMKRYPALKAASVHFSGAAIITRIDSESRAGKPLSDVVLSGQLGVLALIEKKVAARYRSPEREFYRDGFKDKEGLWTAYMTNVMVSAYNTRQVKKEEAPRAVEDLLEAAVERQTNDGQPVLCVVWHHAPIPRRRGGTAFYETVERAEYLAPARTASHDPIGGGRGIRHGGGNQSQLGADTKPSRSPAGFCAHSTLLLESEPRLHER